MSIDHLTWGVFNLWESSCRETNDDFIDEALIARVEESFEVESEVFEQLFDEESLVLRLELLVEISLLNNQVEVVFEGFFNICRNVYIHGWAHEIQFRNGGLCFLYSQYPQATVLTVL